MQRTRVVKYYLAATVALATFLVYLPALRNQFVWDDDLFIVENPHISSSGTALLKWIFFDFVASNWHPLTLMSHVLDYALWGLNPAGHHLTNIVLHAVNTFLVVLLIIRLLDAWQERTTPSSLLAGRAVLVASGVAGLLFGLHPVHVESVAWVSERKDLLCALFYLLSVITYVKYVNSQESGAGSQKSTIYNRHYLAALGFFILALLSKPMAVSLPVVLLILDWYPLQRIYSFRTLRHAFVEKLPYIGLSLFLSIVTILAQKSGGSLSALDVLSIQTRVKVAAKSLVAYLVKMIAPFNLIPFYPYPKPTDASLFEYLGAAVIVVGITLACIVTAKKQKLWLSVWGYYVVTLIPVLGIIQVGGQSMADRYTYLPSLGPFLLAGLGAAWLWATVNKQKKWGLPLKFITSVLAAFVFVFLAYATVEQIGIWKDSITLWSDVIEKLPKRVIIAYNNRAGAFEKIGQIDQAIADYDMAITLYPSYYEALTNRGAAFIKKGYLDKALADFDDAIESKPSYVEAYMRRASVFGKIGRFDKAIEDFDRVIALRPTYAEAYMNRASVFGKIGRSDKAIEDFDRAIALSPKNYQAYNNRGLFYAETGQVEKAIEDFHRALAFSPSAAAARIYFNLGIVYGKTGRFDKAIESFNGTLAVDPNFADGYLNRGITYSSAGQYDRALSDFTAAILVDHNNARALFKRGELYFKTGQRDLAVSDYQAACKLGNNDGCNVLRSLIGALRSGQ